MFYSVHHSPQISSFPVTFQLAPFFTRSPGIISIVNALHEIMASNDWDHEDLEAYKNGGLHPVYIGEGFDDDDRYQAVYKLGNGAYATVWLARDARDKRWVALKIIRADESDKYRNGQLEDRPLIVNSPSFVATERAFWHKGPNGMHRVLVFPAMGPNFYSLSNGVHSRLDAAWARDVARQAASGMAELHADGLAHGGELLLDMNAWKSFHFFKS